MSDPGTRVGMQGQQLGWACPRCIHRGRRAETWHHAFVRELPNSVQRGPRMSEAAGVPLLVVMAARAVKADAPTQNKNKNNLSKFLFRCA